MKVYRITLLEDTNPYIDKSIKSVLDGIEGFLQYEDVGEKLTIEVLEMDETDYDNLTEWEGL